MAVAENTTITRQPGPIPVSEIDLLLTVQIAVAWAGEGGEVPRLGWWKSDLVSEFGGEDLFKQLLPHTWQWAVLQAVREAARRRDAELRRQDNDPDRILSLYSLGFEVDEHIDERLRDLKREGRRPMEALPGLKDVLADDWQPGRFGDWVQGHGEANYVKAPIGRRIKGNPPESLSLAANHLVAGLWPLAGEYPLPHYRRAT